MMQHLCDEKCPTCGAETTSLSQSNQHVNKHWNEQRTYRCGYELRFSPNFMATEVEQRCGKDPKELQYKEKREQALVVTRQFITGLDCDTRMKDHLLANMQYIKWNTIP